MEDYTNKRIAIVGFAREGISSYNFLRSLYPKAHIGLFDEKALEDLAKEAQQIVHDDEQVTFYSGNDRLSSLKAQDVIVKSAGVPPLVIASFVDGKTITSATQLFFDACKGTIIGVTGTKGKSTTASLIHTVLFEAGADTVLCGNIGIPALEILPKIHEHTIVVMELSSHQLQSLQKSPQIAVLQNIVPEHLDYYENFEAYVSAKENITRFQGSSDYLLYNAHYPIPYEIAQRSNAKRLPFNEDLGETCCFVSENKICVRFNGKEEAIIRCDEVPLLGAFNMQNVMPAILIGKLHKIPTEKIQFGIKKFKGLEDRLEFVGTVNGVDYYDDSLSTVPESAIAAIDSFTPRVETLIAGGFDRGLDFTQLAKKILISSIRTLILFPTTGEKIWQAVDNELRKTNNELRIEHYFVENMKEAIKIAKKETKSGKICLLSPASPSFGIFKDYHDRANQFKKLLRMS